MSKNTQPRQCLVCFNDIDQQPSLFHLFYQPTLCLSCLNKFLIYNKCHDFHGYKITILYYYNDFFKQLLFQYKGQGDYALKDAFLNAYPAFKIQYRQHLIALVPSSQQDDQRRGFNPNKMIVRSFSNNIFTGLYKSFAYKQTSQKDRSQVSKIIKIKDGHQLYNQNVIIFDDVITSGNTIMTCAKLIASFHPKTISIIVMASNQLDKLFK